MPDLDKVLSCSWSLGSGVCEQRASKMDETSIVGIDEDVIRIIWMCFFV